MSDPIRIRESSGRVVKSGGRPVSLRESASAGRRPARDIERELAESLRGLGLSPDAAAIGARGRDPDTGGPREITRRESPDKATRSTADRYRELGEAFKASGLGPRGVAAALRGREADDPYAMLTPSERGYRPADFAIVIDQGDDSTWDYQLVNRPGETADAALVQAAVGDLFHNGVPSGQAAGLSSSDLAATRRKLSVAWDAAFANWQFPPAKPEAIA
jgi:hypothetical protein